jgi:head-tail adaptor
MIGKMQPIEFVLPSLTPTASGGDVESLVVVLSTHAYARPTSSNRTFLNEEGVLMDSYNFDVHWRPDFVPTKRHLIKYRNRYYTINGVTNLEERRRFWRIFAITQDDNA